MPIHPENRAKKFWAQVVKANGDGCWEWKGGWYVNGYGIVRVNGRPVGAHRYAYQLATGIAPGEFCVLHKCDNPKCVRPEHLFLGTRADNAADCSAKKRSYFQKHPEWILRGELNPMVARPEIRLYGEANGSSKLTADQVRNARQKYAAGGISQRRLATELGISQGTLGAILRNEAWKQIA